MLPVIAAAARRCSSSSVSVKVMRSCIAPFSVASTPLRNDIIQEMYLKEIKSYRPSGSVQTAKEAGLSTAFPFPAAPPAPVLVDKAAVASTMVADEAEEKEEAWPALVDPIDNPELYNENFEFSCEKDDGRLFMTRKREVSEADFEEHH